MAFCEKHLCDCGWDGKSTKDHVETVGGQLAHLGYQIEDLQEAKGDQDDENQGIWARLHALEVHAGLTAATDASENQGAVDE